MKYRNPHNRALVGHSTIWMGLCTITFSLLAAVPAAHAADAIWDGDTDALWATEANWDATPVPGTGNTATFNAGTSFNPIDVGTISLSKIVCFFVKSGVYAS